MSAGGVPRENSNTPPAYWALYVSNAHHPTHVPHGGYPIGVGVDRVGTHTKRDHRYLGQRTNGYSMEGSRGAHRFYDVPHGFWARRGTGTDIMELKLAQKLTSVDHNPFFLVFLNLWQAYDTVRSELIILTLEGYGAGPHLCGLLETF